MENLETYKGKLLSLKQELTHRVEMLNKDKTRQNGVLDADSEERATAMQNDEVVDHLDELERAELTQIESALQRIEAGTYGNCTNCGETISEKRLSAIPFATDCINCKA